MKNYKFDSSRNISGSLALIIIMTLSVLIAWFSLRAAEGIIGDTSSGIRSNINKRIK